MYTIRKKFTFSAAHALIDLPHDHKCARYHGHNYVIDVVLGSTTLDRVGFVRDYGELDTFGQWIKDTLDHRWLGYGDIGRLTDRLVGTGSNHHYQVDQHSKPVFTFNPTAENMARHMFDFAATLYPEVIALGVSETEKTWAYYTPEGSGYDQ